jgi:hypothetical protein
MMHVGLTSCGEKPAYSLEVSFYVGQLSVNLRLPGVNLVPKFLKALALRCYQSGKASG